MVKTTKPAPGLARAMVEPGATMPPKGVTVGAAREGNRFAARS